VWVSCWLLIFITVWGGRSNYLDVHPSVEDRGSICCVPRLKYCIEFEFEDCYRMHRPRCTTRATGRASGAWCTVGITMLRHLDTDKVIKFVKFIVLILSRVDSIRIFREYFGKTTLKFIEYPVQRSIIERTLLCEFRMSDHIIRCSTPLTSS
jgi:hypothetical protein